MNNQTIIAGVDEAGRGPLAGPVVASAVILNPKHPIAGLKDSKKMSHHQRLAVAQQIKAHSIAWALGSASVAEIDTHNILQATLMAMSRAIEALANKPSEVLIDGNTCPPCSYPCRAIIGGDNLVPAISAASILAKVARDLVMLEADQSFPNYGFAKHKGYGTQAHRQAIAQHGPCPIHRRSFAPMKHMTQAAHA